MLAHRFLVGCVLVFCVVCIRPLFCVPNVASFSELLIVVLVFCAMFCVLFVFILSSSCVLCTQCCQFLWNVHSWLPLSAFSNVYLLRRSRQVFMSLTDSYEFFIWHNRQRLSRKLWDIYQYICWKCREKKTNSTCSPNQST
jgi:hypothetical protein